LTGQKGVIIATIIAAVITAGVSLFIYFDKKKEGLKVVETKNVQKQTKGEDGKPLPSPSLNFAEVFVTPIDTNIPSSFYAEISNSGTESAKDFFVKIDFGESTPEKCEWVPPEIARLSSGTNSSIQSWNVSELMKNQSIYIVCSTNSPFFKSITVGGGNVEYDKQLTYTSYKEQREGESTSFYERLFKFILGALAGIFLFYLFLRLMKSLD